MISLYVSSGRLIRIRSILTDHSDASETVELKNDENNQEVRKGMIC